VDIKFEQDQAIAVVSDNGKGIHPDHVKSIFEMFYRATEDSQGSGLGLYIVKETIEKLQGSIQVQSIPRKGTTFTIQLPNLE
jgi:signal transduction histidine kinase